MTSEHLPVAADGPSAPDNVIAYADQAMFMAARDAGQQACSQAIWIYEHPLDLEGVRRFYDNFTHGLMARRIEPSPLPFGRHRWVAASGPQHNYEISDRPRNRDELFDWADEQVALPLDPEHGPGWRMGVQPFTDGSTAVSLLWSHCVSDGGAAVIAVLEAVKGKTRNLNYPPPRSRTRRQIIIADLRQAARDTPEMLRTIGKAIKLAYGRRHELRGPIGPKSESAVARSSGGSDSPLVPSTAVFLDIADWDARAEALGGNSFSLVAGFMGRLAANLNRVRASDGVVSLIIPVNERESFDEIGANVVSIAHVSFDPSELATDLTVARNAIRDGLRKAREVPDEMAELLPAIPLLPKRALAKVVDVAFGFSTDLPSSCSNMGDLPSDLQRVDGTEAEYFCFRGIDRDVKRDDLDRRGGLLTVTTGRFAGKLSLSVISYQPGGDNTHDGLRGAIRKTLGEFSLTGTVL